MPRRLGKGTLGMTMKYNISNGRSWEDYEVSPITDHEGSNLMNDIIHLRV